MSEEARRLKANRKLEGKPCGWCQSPLKLGDDAVLCSADQAEHHAKCWDEKGGCSRTGCVNAPLKRLDVAPPGFPPVPPQPGFGAPYAPPPFGQPPFGGAPYGNLYGAPPYGAPPFAPQGGPFGPQGGAFGSQGTPFGSQGAPFAAPAPPPPPPTAQGSGAPTTAWEQARPQQPSSGPRPPLRSGFKFCTGCGNQVLQDSQICDFCNAILTPDGIYRGPMVNAPGSVASLVYGIIGLFPCTAVVFGVLALVKSREAKSAIMFNPRYDGGGLATAGMVLGIIDLCIGGIFWIARFLG